MGTSKTRQYKINWLLAHISAVMREGKIVDKEKLIANFCLTHASKRETCLEILKQLEFAGRIKIIENEIWTSENYEADQILNGSKPKE